MHVTPENIDYFRDLAARLNGVGRGDRGPLIQDAMTFLGWSKSRVYNALKDVGWQSGRKPRSDRGGSKVSAETAQTVSSLMRQSCRDNGKMLLSAKDASAIAFYNNMIPRNDFTGATLFRAMRQHHVHPDHIRKAAPCVQMRSLHPNHVWEFDVSVCVLFYMKGGNKLKEMSGKDYYKNKPENFEKIAKERVLRYLACDHYTGAFYVQYFLSPGETSEVLFEFLMSAFTKRHDQDPFHGVPFKLIWDAGCQATRTIAPLAT